MSAKTVRLRHSGGAYVGVPASKVDRLLSAGFSLDDDTDGQAASSPEGYEAMTVDELKDEIRARNEDRDDDARLPLTGTKAELVAVLEADD